MQATLKNLLPFLKRRSTPSVGRPVRGQKGTIKGLALGRRLRTFAATSPVQWVQRFDYAARSLYYRSVFYPFIEYDAEIAEAPTHTAPDLWAGDVEHGKNIKQNTFSFMGRTVNMGKSVQWAPQGVSDEWQMAFHSFEWIADLRATQDPQAKTIARELVGEWIDVCGAFHMLRWHPHVLSTRLTSWLTHSSWLLDGADGGWREKFMHSLTRQANHLPKVMEWDVGGHRLIRNLKAQIFASLCLPSRQSAYLEAEDLLKQQLKVQVLPDGMHHERSPYYHMMVLKDLLDIHAMIIKAGQTPAPSIDETIDRMSVTMAFFRHPDGGLALFNDGEIGNIDLLDDIQERCGLAETVPAELPYAGYVRLDNGPIALLFDGGLCAPMEGTRHAHADTLSFELSYGEHRVFVNSGTSGVHGSSPQRNKLRGTDAHNTISLNNLNSAEVWGDGLLGRRPRNVSCSVREEPGMGIGLEASHDGYSYLGAKHTRRLFLNSEGNDLRCEDMVETRKREWPVQAHFHLHPTVKYKLISNAEAELTLPDGTLLSFRVKGGQLFDADADYCPEYDQPVAGRKLFVRGTWQNKKCVINWGLREK